MSPGHDRKLPTPSDFIQHPGANDLYLFGAVKRQLILLFRSPAYNVHTLQCVQNSLSRVVLPKLYHPSTRDLFHQLHWLPIEKRIQYKLNH